MTRIQLPDVADNLKPREKKILLLSVTKEFGVRVLYLTAPMAVRVPRASGEHRMLCTEEQAKQIAAHIQGFLGKVEPQ